MSRRYWIPQPANAVATLAAFALIAWAVWVHSAVFAPAHAGFNSAAGVGCPIGVAVPYVVQLPDGNVIIAERLDYNVEARRVVVYPAACVFRSGFE